MGRGEEELKNKSRSRGFKTSLLILIVLISVYLFLHSSIFNITQINISGNEKVSREEVLALAGISPGEKLFAVDKSIVAKSIGVHPLVKSCSIARRLPHTLAITLVERKVWAIIPYEESFLCIDNEGICIDKLSNFTDYKYPIITLDQKPPRVNYGQAVEPEAIKMIGQVWQAMSESSRQNISEFHYVNKDNSLILYTINGTEIRFGNLERLAEKIDNLAQVTKIESDLEKEGKDVLEYVDIRFKGQPVIKTKT